MQAKFSILLVDAASYPGRMDNLPTLLQKPKNLHAWMPVSIAISYLESWLPILTGLFIIFLSSPRQLFDNISQ